MTVLTGNVLQPLIQDRVSFLFDTINHQLFNRWAVLFASYRVSAYIGVRFNGRYRIRIRGIGLNRWVGRNRRVSGGGLRGCGHDDSQSMLGQ